MTANHPQALGLRDTSAHVGALCWVADQLFEIEGRWGPRCSDAAATVHLATHSRHHGWHSHLWRQALPDSPALDAPSMVRAPSPQWAEAVQVARSLVEAQESERFDVAVLSTLYRSLIPASLVLLDQLASGLHGPADRHLQRIAGLVRPDLVTDLAQGYALLAHALANESIEETALTCTKALDQAFRNC